MSNYYLKLNLQLFAEGGGEGGAGVGAPNSTETGDMSAIIYGKQDGGQVQDAAGQQDDRAARFEEMIKGEFKDLYGQRVQDTVQKRLKSTNETVAKFNRMAPMMELLASKYGVEAGDIDALTAAIEDDDSYWEDEALEKGISVQQLKESKKLQRENEYLREQVRQQEVQENADRIYADWIRQGEELGRIYGGFNLDTELQNPEFSNLLRLGIDMKTAFEVIHHDEIMPAAMQYAANTAQQKMAKSIAANGRRPMENGLGSRATAIYKPDVSSLTKADMEEINRRVAAGEKIRF